MGQSCGTSNLDKASQEIDVRIETLDLNIETLGQQIREYAAKAASDPSAKQRALQLMKRKKVFEEQRHQLIGAQFNVDSLADQQAQAHVTLKAVEAMKAGKDRLKKRQELMSVHQVDELLDDAADAADELRAISEALGQGSSLAELEFASEYAQLQRELAGFPVGIPEQAVAVGAMSARRQPAPNTEARRSIRQEPAQPLPRDTYEETHGSTIMKEATREAIPQPPVPPPSATVAGSPPPSAAEAAAQKHRERYAELWAESALKAAMAPYGHLPLGALPPFSGLASSMHAPPPPLLSRRIPLAA
jgi:charged multivesicular body protein 5